MPLVNIQGVNQCRSLQNNAHACMPVAVNATLVSLGVAKPALQVEIVLGQVGSIAAHEESGLEAGQHLGHLLAHGISAAPQLLAEDREPSFA